MQEIKQARPEIGPPPAPGIELSAKIPTIKEVIRWFLKTLYPKEQNVSMPVLAVLSANEDIYTITSRLMDENFHIERRLIQVKILGSLDISIFESLPE